MSTKTTAAVCILAAVAIFFAFSANTEATKDPVREAAPKERILLVASYSVGDFVAPLKEFKDTPKIEGHDKKEVIDALNRCKILIFDRQEWSDNGWSFPPIRGKGWPKLLLEGETVSKLKDTNGVNVTLAIESVEMGGSTTLPKNRKFTLDVLVRRINQGDVSNYDGVLWVTHKFDGRLLKYDSEGNAELSVLKGR